MSPDTGHERGGLPEDEALDAFGAAAAAAFQPRKAAQPTPTTAPQAPVTFSEQGLAEAALPASLAHPRRVVAPLAALPVEAVGRRGTDQCTVMIDQNVRTRFEQYQTVQKVLTGREPTNAVVVRRAVLHAQRHGLYEEMLSKLRSRAQPAQEEDADPDGLFGVEVTGRRTERGRVKNRTQQSFRPSARELAVIDGLTDQWGFPSRSDFVNEVLDAFLPALKRERGRAG
ncbi:hypothetical protein [Streptomyces sp. NPDC048350]|uniref:hypothetical protein n=1 Tax=Streptomyces sp. NPDC048350 TaxID=3365538 RepID=UPI003713E160